MTAQARIAVPAAQLGETEIDVCKRLAWFEARGLARANEREDGSLLFREGSFDDAALAEHLERGGPASSLRRLKLSGDT